MTNHTLGVRSRLVAAGQDAVVEVVGAARKVVGSVPAGCAARAHPYPEERAEHRSELLVDVYPE